MTRAFQFCDYHLCRRTYIAAEYDFTIKTFQALAKELGLSPGRVQQLYHRERERQKRTAKCERAELAIRRGNARDAIKAARRTYLHRAHPPDFGDQYGVWHGDAP